MECPKHLDIENKPYTMCNIYKDICQGCQMEKLQKDLLHRFNDLGVSFCFCDGGLRSGKLCNSQA